MLSTVRSVLLGTDRSEYHPYPVVGLAVGVVSVTLLTYAVDLFTVSGGVVWIPFHAAVVGMVAGFWVGYARWGLLSAWLVTYTALLGYHAESAFVEQSGEGFVEQLGYFVRLDGLSYLAVVGIALGTIVFALGWLLRWGNSVLGRNVAKSRSR